MSKGLTGLVAACVCAAWFGCSAAEGPAGGPSRGTAARETLPDSGAPSGDAGNGGSPGARGLPCDIEALLQHYCVGCHSDPPAEFVPMSLVHYGDLIATRGNPPRAVGERAVDRLQKGTMPPPGNQAPTPAEIAAFAAWLQAGMPPSGCNVAVDAGPLAPNPYDTPLQCSSGRQWTEGDEDSPLMHPGGACIDCHFRDDEGEAPRFTIGGTVYKTAHEPNDCFGVAEASENVVVQITDAQGGVFTLRVNEAGNFFYEGANATPYSAKLMAAGKERVMPVKQTSGDCNGCHTVNGTNRAPGRIMAP